MKEAEFEGIVGTKVSNRGSSQNTTKAPIEPEYEFLNVQGSEKRSLTGESESD
jgi:hypothetical protein